MKVSNPLVAKIIIAIISAVSSVSWGATLDTSLNGYIIDFGVLQPGESRKKTFSFRAENGRVGVKYDHFNGLTSVLLVNPPNLWPGQISPDDVHFSISPSFVKKELIPLSTVSTVGVYQEVTVSCHSDNLPVPGKKLIAAIDAMAYPVPNNIFELLTGLIPNPVVPPGKLPIILICEFAGITRTGTEVSLDYGSTEPLLNLGTFSSSSAAKIVSIKVTNNSEFNREANIYWENGPWFDAPSLPTIAAVPDPVPELTNDVKLIDWPPDYLGGKLTFTPGQTREVRIKFSPTQAGDYWGLLRVEFSDDQHVLLMIAGDRGLL